MPKCGNCKADHGSVQEVKDCYNLGSPASSQAVAQAQAQPSATEKQVAFVKKLAGERETPVAGKDENEAKTIARFEDLLGGGKFVSKAEAHKVIDWLLIQPKVQGKGAGATQLHPDLEDGVYRNADGTFVKVYHAVHGSGQQVSKFLVVTEPDCGGCANGEPCGAGCKFTSEWEYMGKRGLKGLLPAHKLTQEEAKEFGLVYGMCVRCGRELTRDESIHVGYGKTCAGHEGWWYPTKAELKALTATAAA